MHSLQRANPFTDFGERLAAIGEARGKATSRGSRLERSESPNSTRWLGAELARSGRRASAKACAPAWPRLREERGDFFMQPHQTFVVWGGQKALFIFQHHSRRFRLYYDLQTSGGVSAP